MTGLCSARSRSSFTLFLLRWRFCEAAPPFTGPPGLPLFFSFFIILFKKKRGGGPEDEFKRRGGGAPFLLPYVLFRLIPKS